MPSALAIRRSKCDLARPPDNLRLENLEVTRAAIDRLISIKVGEQAPPRAASKSAPLSISYKPAQSSQEHEIEVIERQNDPLEPPRHRYRKPKPFDEDVMSIASVETRAPVLRQKQPKLSKSEKEQWVVPASVSNWKNGRGFLIDLDHRAKTSAQLQTSSNTSKQADLSLALAQAANEMKDSRTSNDSLPQRQDSLRQKLLDQRDQKRQADTESEDLFDVRLFHTASKRHQTAYDDSLFGSRQQTRKKRKHSLEFEK